MRVCLRGRLTREEVACCWGVVYEEF
jgi:hypothetical protein